MNERCDLGVGCEESNVCYAEAHGAPERCGAKASPRQVAEIEAAPETEDPLAGKLGFWPIDRLK